VVASKKGVVASKKGVVRATPHVKRAVVTGVVGPRDVVAGLAEGLRDDEASNILESMVDDKDAS
jgi:hypothetical protein